MKYKKKNIDDVFRNKNWEGVKSFVDKFGMNLLILLDKIVKAKDWEKLKDFVKTYSIEPLIEFGMPVGGEGVKELYDISDRYHAHKHKTGAEWWLRDEIRDACLQLKGHSGDVVVQEKAALLWKDVDAEIDGAPEIKVSAFRKILISELIQGIYSPEIEEEAGAMKRIKELFRQRGFSKGLGFDHELLD
jgi:hypothetical protein